MVTFPTATTSSLEAATPNSGTPSAGAEARVVQISPGAKTDNVELPEMVPWVAEISELPAATPKALPPAEIVAAAGVPEPQVTNAMRSNVVASE